MTRASTMSTGTGNIPFPRRFQWPTGVNNGRNNLDLMRWVGTLQRSWSAWFANPVPWMNQVEMEKNGAGDDIWSADAVREGHFPEHLVVMVNGLSGSPNDWQFAAEQFVKKLPDKVIVHRSRCNTAKLTFDGVDRMGERLAEEVRSVIASRNNLTKISFVAHSLGGLIARYAIGKLYEDTSRSDQDSRGRIAGLDPMNFVTSATPHLGSRGHKQLPFLFGLSLLEKTAVGAAHLIVGRTGKHLFLTDNDEGNVPLLVRMVHDQRDLKFISALRAFKRRVAYANVNYDHIVGWRTSSFRRPNELPTLMRAYSDKYPNIVNIDNGDSPNCERLDSAVLARTGDFEEEMIRGLTQVHWERIDVMISKSRLRYNAHYNIQVRNKLWNSDGADVIFHMIDNFLV